MWSIRNEEVLEKEARKPDWKTHPAPCAAWYSAKDSRGPSMSFIIEEQSFLLCEDLLYGRMSFRGFNPEVEGPNPASSAPGSQAAALPPTSTAGHRLRGDQRGDQRDDQLDDWALLPPTLAWRRPLTCCTILP
ncbi:hypothetical protein QTO34_010600 [Cnephaeus nilssonii]|uniref:Uncharacterized protein n=1 Tax=Cnephaeus nilssonii TaxID=3371016 RepID=A0AA40HGS5_CNENI|nr:hypothetical protein QTO34_010600 [Eptesicus nilssonii]